VTSRPERRAALFDLDGTLVDSGADIAASANHARSALGLPALPIADIRSFVGDGAARLIERVTPGASVADRARAMDAFHAHYAAHCCDATVAYPGAIAALARLRDAGWALGVCTNKPLAYSERILAYCGLVVDGVRGGDRTRKPDPGQLHELIAALATTPARTWMIGDHHTDLHAAAAAGCRALFCTWGFGRRGDARADADAASLDAVVDTLLRSD